MKFFAFGLDEIVMEDIITQEDTSITIINIYRLY